MGSTFMTNLAGVDVARKVNKISGVEKQGEKILPTSQKQVDEEARKTQAAADERMQEFRSKLNNDSKVLPGRPLLSQKQFLNGG